MAKHALTLAQLCPLLAKLQHEVEELEAPQHLL